MTTDWIGKPRVESAERRLRELNPLVEIETLAENVGEGNAASLVARADLIVGAAPLFAERLLLNREAIRQGKPLVDCAMYELEGRVMTVLPRQTACLACLYPEPPANWKREFPVFSAVSSTVGSLAAMEAIKLIAGIGPATGGLAGLLLTFDLRDMTFRTIAIARRSDCAVCGPSTHTPT
jgi:molybdopterin/thiamine biosynthesis adenylyltransferase